MTVLTTSRLSLTPDLYPGYRLLQMRGRGGFGEVWEAQDDRGQRVALKFLPCARGGSASQELRSIQMVRQLSHPHLTRIDRVWCAPGVLVVAMELADGSLGDLLDAHRAELGAPIPPEQLLPLLAQAAQGLDFLNTRQHLIQGQWATVQHCDVTPANLLLFGQTVKLTDFGLTTALATREKGRARGGVPDFAAPEVFQSRLSDRTDQYALAVCYCLLRGGRLPFPDSPADFQLGYTRPAPDLTMLGPAERPVVARGLASAPQDRWPSSSALVAELRRVTLPQPEAAQDDPAERRREPRHRPCAAVNCEVLPTLGNKPWKAAVENVSASGARLRVLQPGCPLGPGRVLDVVLVSTVSGLRAQVRLRLAHARELPGGDYEVGGALDRTLNTAELHALTGGVG